MSLPKRGPGVVTCFLTMACMDVLPRIIGLRRTFGLMRRLMPSLPEPRAAAEIVNQTIHNVALAGAFYLLLRLTLSGAGRVCGRRFFAFNGRCLA